MAKVPSGGTLRRRITAEPGNGLVLDANHPAVLEGRPLFERSVVWTEDTKALLKTGHYQRKIGKQVVKGRWRGFPIYCLTLPERETCPSECEHWRDCYGNNMHWAQRVRPDKLFEDVLWDELEELQAVHPAGFAVRLHVLGDFYSTEYVDLWVRALDAFPALHCFGFTRRWAGEPIGDLILDLIRDRWDRFAIRVSGIEAPFGSTTYEPGEDPAGIPCPAQTGATECCGTCGLCWATTKPIAFASHSRGEDAPWRR